MLYKLTIVSKLAINMPIKQLEIFLFKNKGLHVKMPIGNISLKNM